MTNPDEQYFKNAYATVVLYRKLDKMAKKMNLSYKSNVVAHTLGLMSYIYDKQIDLNDIWERKDLSPVLNDIVAKLLTIVHSVIINPPTECPEARMWARKEKCWDIVKNVSIDLPIVKTGKKIEFFAKNDALAFISNLENFNNSLTWMKLSIWDNKMHILSKQQLSYVKMMRNYADSKTLTKKQIDSLKDAFIAAVKAGYQYK